MRKPHRKAFDRPSSRVEIMLGRSLAACIHPYVAWRYWSTWERARMVVGYAILGYIGVLGTLVIRTMILPPSP
jgi:hypothetical protein